MLQIFTRNKLFSIFVQQVLENLPFPRRFYIYDFFHWYLTTVYGNFIFNEQDQEIAVHVDLNNGEKIPPLL